MEELAELSFIRTTIKRNGNPDQVHHGKAGKKQAKQHAAIGFFDNTFGIFRIIRHGRVADSGKRTDKTGKFVAVAVPAQVNTLGSQIDIGQLNTGFAHQPPFNQPNAGSTMDALYQQVNIAQIAGAGDKFLLYLIEVIDVYVLGRLRRRGKQRSFGGALVIALQTRVENGSAYRLAAHAAKIPRSTVQMEVIVAPCRNRQAAMKTANGASNVVQIHNADDLLRLCNLKLAASYFKHIFVTFDANAQFPIAFEREADVALVFTR